MKHCKHSYPEKFCLFCLGERKGECKLHGQLARNCELCVATTARAHLEFIEKNLLELYNKGEITYEIFEEIFGTVPGIGKFED